MATKLRKTADRALQSPRVIVCEGADEFDVLCWVRTQKRGLTESDVELIDAKGRANLKTMLDDLRSLSGGSDVKLVAVVLDAEERSAADQSLLDDLQTVAQTRGFVLSVHVLPDNDTPGALETLVRKHADRAAPSASCANAWEACMAATAVHRTTAQKDKAWGHVWLAGQGAFHSRLGHAMANNADVRESLPLVIQRFEAVLDEVLNANL